MLTHDFIESVISFASMCLLLIFPISAFNYLHHFFFCLSLIAAGLPEAKAPEEVDEISSAEN